MAGGNDDLTVEAIPRTQDQQRRAPSRTVVEVTWSNFSLRKGIFGNEVFVDIKVSIRLKIMMSLWPHFKQVGIVSQQR